MIISYNMLIFFVNYYPFNKTNGITRYQETLFSSNSKNIKLVNVFVKAPVEQITESHDGNILIPFDLASGKNPMKNDEIVSCFLDDKVRKEKSQNEILFHINWMNHTPWVYTQRKHTPLAKFLLTKHCVAWREMILTNYKIFYHIKKNAERKSLLPFPIKRFISDELYYFSFVDKIITVTDDAKHLLISNYGIPEQKVFRIHNGCDSIYNIQKNKKKEDFGISKTDKVVLYVGTISELKGLMALLQIISEVVKKQGNTHLIICGSGQYEQLFESLPKELLGKISIVGQKKLPEIMEIASITDLAILPSIVEQCSYAALELIAAGVPTITANTKGVQEIIPKSKRKHAIVFSQKEEGLTIKLKDATEKILKLLNNKALSEEYAKETKLRVSRLFNKEIMCKKTHKIYKHLVLSQEHFAENNTSPLVSIIMPCYNCKQYLNEAIESVIQQTYQNWELIIIDDGSEYHCQNIINRFQDRRIKLIQNSTNRGIVYSLRRGIREAKGEYIARFDADDIMMPKRIMAQVSFLQKHPEYSMVGSNHYWSIENDYPIGYTIYPETPEEINFYRYFQNPFSHPTTMIRAKVLEKLNYETKYKYCEDYALWMEICKNMKTYNIQDGLIIYRTHKENISRKNNEQQNRNSLELIFDKLNEHKISLTHEEELVLTAIHMKKNSYLREKNRDSLQSLLSKINIATGHHICENEIDEFIFSLVAQKEHGSTK